MDFSTEFWLNVNKLRCELVQKMRADEIRNFCGINTRREGAAARSSGSGQQQLAQKPRCVERDEVLYRIEKVILQIVTDLSKGRSPVLKYPSRTSWNNVRYDIDRGMVMQTNPAMTEVRFSDRRTMTRFDIRSEAKFILVIEKDATFQKLIDDKICEKLQPSIIITGKGFPDVNTRIMLRRLWDCLQLPVFCLVDADPHGVEIMCIYRFGSKAMSFESGNLTIPSVRWLGVLPSDIMRVNIPRHVQITLTESDKKKISDLKQRDYIKNNPAILREVDMLSELGVKAEIQALSAISPRYLLDVYLTNKIHHGGWI